MILYNNALFDIKKILFNIFQISVMGDFTNWHIKSPMIRKGDYWYEQTGSRNEEYATDYVILCLWFPSVDQAKTWVHYDVDFKISSFPEPYGVELLILPINYIPMNGKELIFI